MLDPEQINRLWSLACEDAGLDPEKVLLVLATTHPPDLALPRNAYWPPGPAEGLPPITLTDQEYEQVAAAADRHRVGLPLGYPEEVTLALMRWALEQARQWESGPDVWEFAAAHVSHSLGPVYSPLGPGSMVVNHFLPTNADADAAAANLVTRIYGPQIGQLRGPMGTLLRPREPEPLDTLGQRIVVYVAIHATTFDRWVQGATSRDFLLEQLDEQAPSWWRQLLEDEGFGHLCGSVPYFWPTPEEVAAAQPSPARAWDPWRDLIRRAQRRGMEVLGGSESATARSVDAPPDN